MTRAQGHFAALQSCRQFDGLVAFILDERLQRPGPIGSFFKQTFRTPRPVGALFQVLLHRLKPLRHGPALPRQLTYRFAEQPGPQDGLIVDRRPAGLSGSFRQQRAVRRCGIRQAGFRHRLPTQCAQGIAALAPDTNRIDQRFGIGIEQDPVRALLDAFFEATQAGGHRCQTEGANLGQDIVPGLRHRREEQDGIGPECLQQAGQRLGLIIQDDIHPRATEQGIGIPSGAQQRDRGQGMKGLQR